MSQSSPIGVFVTPVTPLQQNCTTVWCTLTNKAAVIDPGGGVDAVLGELARRGLTLDQIDLIELNEAFAAQALACMKELGLDPEKVNVNGGAIALGHPLGCTGAKLTATIVNEMHRRKARYGMVTMCVGGGMGAAGIFERM